MEGALDLKPSQGGVESTLLSVPWPETWNGSLWALFYEAVAYFGVALLCAWGPLPAHPLCRKHDTRLVCPGPLMSSGMVCR